VGDCPRRGARVPLEQLSNLQSRRPHIGARDRPPVRSIKCVTSRTMFDAFASWPQGRTAALPAESCRGKPALQPRAAPINPLQRAQPSAAAAMPPQRPDAPEARGTFSASVSTSPSRCGSSSTQGPPDVRDRLRGGPAVVSRPLAPTTARTNNSSHQQQVVGPARHAPVMRSIHHRVPFTREKPPAAALEEEPGRWTADQPGKCPAGQVRDNADRTRDVADRVSRTFPGRFTSALTGHPMSIRRPPC
jgi:hypothetical protein